MRKVKQYCTCLQSFFACDAKNAMTIFTLSYKICTFAYST